MVKKTLSAMDMLIMREFFRKYPEIKKVFYDLLPSGNNQDSSTIDLVVTMPFTKLKGQELAEGLNRLLPHKFSVILTEEMKNRGMARHIERSGLTIYP